MPSSLLPLDPDHLLSTTRAVRKRLDFERPLDPALVTQCALIPVAHVKGRPEFEPGPRKPLDGVLHLNGW